MMPREPDVPRNARVTEPSVVHSNPVTQAGFTQIPNAVMLRKDITPLAKLVYGYLKHLAWRGDAAAPLEQIADDLGVSPRALQDYMKELRKAPAAEGGDEAMPRLVVSERRGLGLPNLYIVNDPVLRDGMAESAIQSGNARHSSRGRVSLPEGIKTKDLEGEANASPPDVPNRAPKLQKLDGQNIAMDALAEVCSVDLAGGRGAELGAALNQRQVGIRDQFWRECVAYAESVGRLDELSQTNFEAALVKQIRRKAKLYRERFSDDVEMSPGALRKWWSDLEVRKVGAGLSAAEMAAYDA